MIDECVTLSLVLYVTVNSISMPAYCLQIKRVLCTFNLHLPFSTFLEFESLSLYSCLTITLHNQYITHKIRFQSSMIIIKVANVTLIKFVLLTLRNLNCSKSSILALSVNVDPIQ